MKILKTIINEQHKPIGLEVSGQSWEFGGIGNAERISQVSIESLQGQRFKNSQVEMKNGSIIEQGQFKLRSLPMMMLKGDGSTVPVDNKITLLKRIIVDGKLAGFDVRIGGMEKRLRSDSIIGNAGWFEPDNFVIRYGDKTRYIAGKPGMGIDKLPEEAITTAPVTNKKHATRTVTEGKGHEYSTKMVSPFDMISLTEILCSLGGQYIYLPGTKYNRITEDVKALDKSFRKTGVEISAPSIEYSEKTVNVSIPFKQIGQLIVNVDGIDKTYYPFAYKMKTVFEAGKLNSPHLGIAIPKEHVERIQSEFGASLSLSVITDVMTNMYVKTFMQLKNPDDIALLSLNTENLSAMSIENARKYKMKEKDIKTTYMKLIDTKICISYTKGIMKEAEAAYKEATGRAARPIYGPYSNLGEGEINTLVDAGIDVFTGAFTKEQSSVELADKKKADETKVDTPKKVAMSVEYGIAGCKTLPTYTTIKAGKVKHGAFATAMAEIEKIKADLAEYKSTEKVFLRAKEIIESLDNIKAGLVKSIWLNNMASFTLGGGQGYGVGSRRNWAPTKTLVNGTAYEYTGTDAEGLTLNLGGMQVVEQAK